VSIPSFRRAPRPRIAVSRPTTAIHWFPGSMLPRFCVRQLSATPTSCTRAPENFATVLYPGRDLTNGEEIDAGRGLLFDGGREGWPFHDLGMPRVLSNSKGQRIFNVLERRRKCGASRFGTDEVRSKATLAGEWRPPALEITQSPLRQKKKSAWYWKGVPISRMDSIGGRRHGSEFDWTRRPADNLFLAACAPTSTTISNPGLTGAP